MLSSIPILKGGAMMRFILRQIVIIVEKACCLTHPFVEYEIRLTGTHCNLAILSCKLDELFKTDVWLHEKRTFGKRR